MDKVEEKMSRLAKFHIENRSNSNLTEDLNLNSLRVDIYKRANT